MPILNRLFRRYDGAIVLRSLALPIRRGQPVLNTSLRLMADIYPLGTVRNWLCKAADEVETQAKTGAPPSAKCDLIDRTTNCAPLGTGGGQFAVGPGGNGGKPVATGNVSLADVV